MSNDVQDQEETEDRPDFKALRAKAASADELAKINAELNKRLVFADAGIDRNTPLGKLLFATYEGDDPEDLRSKASEVGYSFETKLPEPPPDTGPTEADVRLRLAGGSAPDQVEPDSLEHMYKRFHGARNEGLSREAAHLGLIDDVIGAGVRGDPRFRFDQNAWQEYAVEACMGEPRG
jgi:hypothetical protein